jgi:hypothetical protein
MPYNHLLGKGCVACVNLQYSKGQKKVEQFLNEYSIFFKRQKTFDDCINPKTNTKLRFDFYIPEINICIEYDGQQHFKPNNLWGGECEFIKLQERDMVKNLYCKTNNIKLIRISFKEDIYEKLTNFLLPFLVIF